MPSPSHQSLYAPRRLVSDIRDCHFYHRMEVPGVGLVNGEWDLRGDVAGYLGHVDFTGKRVLEIGPASGFCTVAMEQRGAEVVSVELPDEPGWDFVPYPAQRLAPELAPRREIMTKVKNSWWFVHAAHHLRAQQVVAHAADLPPDLGAFDYGVLASVLLHCRDPLGILQGCAAHAKALVITDLLFPELEGRPVAELVANAQNFQWDTWWRFSTQYFIQYLQVMGFHIRATVLSSHRHAGRDGYRMFSIVAERDV